MIVKLPAVVLSDRAMEGSLMAVALDQLGASFSALTVMLAVLLAVEKAVLPPVLVVLTLSPAAPVV
jgi:hypothetical protein